MRPSRSSPPGGAGAQVVDLFPGFLAHVADRQRTGQPIEREPIWVAEPVGIDLVPSGLTDERVRARDRVLLIAALTRVDPDQLAEQRVAILGVLVRIAASTTVAGSEVEVPVGPESDLPAIVVLGEAMPDGDHLSGALLRARRGFLAERLYSAMTMSPY